MEKKQALLRYFGTRVYIKFFRTSLEDNSKRIVSHERTLLACFSLCVSHSFAGKANAVHEENHEENHEGKDKWQQSEEYKKT